MKRIAANLFQFFTDSYSIQRSYRGLCWLRHWCWCGQSAPRHPSTSRLVSASGPFLGSFRLQGRNWKMILWISSWVCGHKSSSQATDSEVWRLPRTRNYLRSLSGDSLLSEPLLEKLLKIRFFLIFLWEENCTALKSALCLLSITLGRKHPNLTQSMFTCLPKKKTFHGIFLGRK